jgi:hypothetical protein
MTDKKNQKHNLSNLISESAGGSTVFSSKIVCQKFSEIG